jgi:flagellar protein FlaG
VLAFPVYVQVAVMIVHGNNSLDPKSSYSSGVRTDVAPASVMAPEPQVKAPTPEDDVTAAPQPPAEQVKKPSAEEAREQGEALARKIADAIPRVRELMQKNQRSLDFQVAEKDNRVIITVIDKETDKVIRQIPPEDVLLIAEAIEQGLEQSVGGLLLSSRA